MTMKGHVANGVIVLDRPAGLPEGAEVEVLPIAPAQRPDESARRPRTLNDVLEPVIGKATNMPPDASVNYEHYLYGLPKQK
jgi:hypothetical protein